METSQQLSYNNLLDFCISMEEDPSTPGDGIEIFRYILKNYFFSIELDRDKGLEGFVDGLEMPDFINSWEDVYNVDIEALSNYIEGETINDSLSGKIMLSKFYLKQAYPHQTPAFSSLPDDSKAELVGLVKKKNAIIIKAFEKFMADIDTDKKRKKITLISLILKNIYLKTARPLNKLDKPVKEIINSIFIDTEEVYDGGQKHSSDMGDDSKIKDLIKLFFMIKQFKDIAELTEIYKNELERFKKRALKFVAKKD